jgi:hypothetical protein
LTMLYRSTHRRCRGGAPVQNLAHSASFHSKENNAPSKPGIKHVKLPVRIESRDRIVVNADRLPSARFGPRHGFSR